MVVPPKATPPPPTRAWVNIAQGPNKAHDPTLHGTPRKKTNSKLTSKSMFGQPPRLSGVEGQHWRSRRITPVAMSHPAKLEIRSPQCRAFIVHRSTLELRPFGRFATQRSPGLGVDQKLPATRFARREVPTPLVRGEISAQPP